MTNPTIAKLATAKAVAEKDFKLLAEQLSEGTTPVRCQILLEGALKKGAPFEQAVAAAVDPWKLLRRALSKLNGATLEALVEEATSVNDDEAEETKLAAKKAIERLIAGQKRLMPGRLTAAISWSLLA